MADAVTAAAIVSQPRGESVGIKAFGKKGERGWTTGPCGCCVDCKQSCAMLWCPCIMQCFLAKRMKENMCVPWFVPAGMITLRTRLRSKLDIEGSICKDCWCILLCGPIAACQMYRELDAVGVPDLPCFGGKVTDLQHLAQD